MLKFLKDYLPYLLCLEIFFAFVRYKGYDCDAALYLLQVMNFLQPERFVNDVPFMFGNQDSFSVFSPIVAQVYRIFGVNLGGMMATFFMLLALGIMLIVLASKWSKLFGSRKIWFPIVLSLFIMLSDKEYGSGCFYLSMFESYLVARVLSEILLVAGLVFFFDKNRYISLVLFAFATALHPLMGGWGLPLWLFFHYPRSRIPVLVLAFLSPLSGLLHVGRFDFYPEDWKPLYYTPGWLEFADYSGLLVFWLAMYRYFKGGILSRFAVNLFWVSLVGFYLQFAGSYLEHVLFYQAQPFRVQWVCTIAAIPVFAFFVCDRLKGDQVFSLRDYAFFVLGICTIAQYQWIALLVACVIIIFTRVGDYNKFNAPQWLIKVLPVAGLGFLLFNSAFCNFIQLSIEQGLGRADLAVGWLQIPGYLGVVERIFLVLLAIVTMMQRKYWMTLIFSIAFCNENLKILPIVGVILILAPKLSETVKNGLLSFAISFSFFEVLSSLHKFNSTETLALEGTPLASIILFVVLSVTIYQFLVIKGRLNNYRALVSLVILFVSIGIWDVFKWDARDEIVALNEKQMDVFFDRPIFPQIKDRGKLLFAVENESPMQSRINFLTGAYADESIYVGEVFYREQFHESNRRRSALLRGDDKPANMTYFKEQVMKIYSNPDTLLSRVRYLCGVGEITHFATDYGNMPLPRQDSVFLDVKRKYVYLYECPTL